MSFSGWASLTSVLFSFLFVVSACWILLSAKGQALMATDEWIPPLLSLGAVALIVLHLILHY